MGRPAWITLLLVSTSLFFTACGPTEVAPPVFATETPFNLESPTATSQPAATPLPTQASSPLGQYLIPLYYEPGYLAIVDGSKLENELLIYSSLGEKSWEPIIRTFKSHYPWVKVKIQELDAAEVFQQANGEIQEGKRTADLVISPDQGGWFQFTREDVLLYRSQEDLLLPRWSRSSLGTYTVSSEPMVMIYNKKLVPVPPGSMLELKKLVQDEPKQYDGQIITYDVEKSTTGFAANWFWIDSKSSAGWELLTALGQAHPRLSTSASEMIEAVGQGSAKIGYFVPLNAVIQALNTQPDLGWSYLADGQPVLFPNMALTVKAASPNSAKLMMDFILSQEGQYALSLGGEIPYRSDIASVTELHLDKLTTQVGAERVILATFDYRLSDSTVRSGFIEKWKLAIGAPPAP
jgi:iron(III) transport system substrate-binding protein